MKSRICLERLSNANRELYIFSGLLHEEFSSQRFRFFNLHKEEFVGVDIFVKLDNVDDGTPVFITA